jgi:hypothetical protein
VGSPLTVLSEEEDVPAPQGPSIIVPSEEEVPPEEEEFPAPAVAFLQGLPVMVPSEEEEVPAAPLSWSHKKKGDALSLYRPW